MKKCVRTPLLWTALVLCLAGGLGRANEPIRLETGLSYLEDRHSKLTFDRVLEQDYRFRALPNGSPSFGYSESAFWFRVPLPENFNRRDSSYLEINYPLHSVTVYTRDSTGLWSESVTGERLAFAERAFRHRNLVLPIPADAESPLYIRVETPTSMQLPMKLWSSKDLMEQMGHEQFYFGLYFGLLGMAAALALLMSLVFKDRTSFLYGAFLLMYGLLQLNINRLASQFLWPHSPALNIGIAPASLGLTLFFMGLFATYYLRIKECRPVVHRILLGASFLAGLAGISNAIIPYRSAISILLFIAPISSFLILMSAALCIRVRREAVIFLAAWSPFVFGLWALLLKAFAVLPSNFWTSYGIQVGSVVGVILFSISMQERYAELRQARAHLATEPEAELILAPAPEMTEAHT